MRKTGERFCLMSKCIKEKRKNYELVQKQLFALIEDETNWIANLSNAAALLNQFLDEINWVGFYLFEEGQLILGPFQGLPACVRIPMGKGVCGTSAATEKTLRIEDVHQFPGHIACDAASRSRNCHTAHEGWQIVRGPRYRQPGHGPI